MAKTLKLDIVTPEKKVFEGEALSITAGGIEGEFGILPGHAPFATVLAPGVVIIKHEGGNEEMMAVSGGYIEVTAEKVILLVESAEKEEDVDVEKIKRRADEKKKLLQSRGKGDLDYDKIQVELMMELSRLKAVEILQRRKKV